MAKPLSGIDTAISLHTIDVKYLSYFVHLKFLGER
jgi:hypothetical protein